MGLHVLGVLVVILAVIACIFWCVQQMMDKIIEEVFIVQERDAGNGMTETSQKSHSGCETVDEGIDMGEGFELRPWNG